MTVSSEQRRAVVALWADGLSFRLIAQRTDLTPGQVAGLRKRLNLPTRLTRPPVRSVRCLVPTEAPYVSDPPDRPPAHVDAPTRPVETIEWLDHATSGPCSWVTRQHPVCYCDAPAISHKRDGSRCPEGAVWCSEHRPQVYGSRSAA